MLLGEEGKEEGVDGRMDGRMDKTGRSLITGAKGKGELHDEMGKTEECSFWEKAANTGVKDTGRG